MTYPVIFTPLSARNFGLLFRVQFALIAIFIVVAIFTPVMPDYETYQSIYETGGGHLAYFGRDPGFIFVIEVLNPLFSYVQFRGLTLFFSAALMLYTMTRLQISLPSQLGITIAIALAPIIAIKFGAQIREGISICLLLAVILGRTEKPNPLMFSFIAILASSMHAATIPLWLLLGLALYVYPIWPRTATLTGIALYGIFVFFVSDLSRYEGDMSVGLSKDSVNPNLYTVMYWLCYPAIFATAHISQSLRIPSDLFKRTPIKTMAFVTGCAMLGWLLGLVFQIGLSGSALLMKSVIGDTMRLAHLLLSLYCILLVICEKRLIGAALSVALLIDSVRILTSA